MSVMPEPEELGIKGMKVHPPPPNFGKNILDLYF